MTSAVGLTRRGWALFGAASGLVVAARLLGALELTVLGVAGLSLLAAAFLWVRSRPPLLEIHRAVHPTRVHAGAEARVDLEVVAPGPGKTPQITLTDAFDGGRRAARFLIPALERQQRARAAYRVPTTRRGRFSLGPAALGIGDPFGLARRTWTDRDTDEITVYPKVHELRAPFGAPGRRRMVSPHTATFHSPTVDGQEFLTLREYERGDDLRRIHWRTTARTGELIVRQDETQWQPLAIVLLDTRASTHDEASFELAVEAVASVVSRLSREGTRFEVRTTAGRTLGTSVAGRRRATGTEARIMDELAVIGTTEAAQLAGATSNLRPATRRGLLIAVVGTLSAPELDLLGGLGTPSAPLVLLRTGAGPSASSHLALTVVDATRGLSLAWDEAMLARARRAAPTGSR
jgi:uncharacterized protein (DUF58 family)